MIFLRSLCVTAIIFLCSCANERGAIPVNEKSQSIYHSVVPGDTLYTIAWRYDLDFTALAVTNHLKQPYVLHPGQRIYLNAKKVTAATAIVKPNKINTPQQIPDKPASASTTALATENIRWHWPSSGKLLSRFNLQTGLNKGIDIEGKLGQPVTAAATGTVVYAGSGLLGYGNLLIVKHNEQYLSAYAHNSRLLVKENDRVTIGQAIAEMGNSAADRVKLHFEIRKEGKPVDPLGYLPARHY